MSTIETFTEYHDFLKSEQDLRDRIREAVQLLEQNAREILTILQRIHQDGQLQIMSLCDEAEGHFTNVKEQYQALSQLIPKDQYYRFHDHWRFVNQRLCFLAALTRYLRTEELITKEEAASLLGVKRMCFERAEVATNREDGFHIDLEDFLSGLLSLANELVFAQPNNNKNNNYKQSRFAVNSVTAGDYSRPLRISKFVGDLNAGFRLLNLKNDSLRKRFDALKYDMKKIEEVVYDLSIRGLKPDASTLTSGDKTDAIDKSDCAE